MFLITIYKFKLKALSCMLVQQNAAFEVINLILHFIDAE